MENDKKCFYCKEIMIYGPQKQVRSKTIKKEGKYINQSETFIEYGWRCLMNNDYCDIVFDKK